MKSDGFRRWYTITDTSARRVVEEDVIISFKTIVIITVLPGNAFQTDDPELPRVHQPELDSLNRRSWACP